MSYGTIVDQRIPGADVGGGVYDADVVQQQPQQPAYQPLDWTAIDAQMAATRAGFEQLNAAIDRTNAAAAANLARLNTSAAVAQRADNARMANWIAYVTSGHSAAEADRLYPDPR